MGSLLTEIVTLLTGGIAQFGEGLASGIISFVEDIFVVVDSSGSTTTYKLTTFGGLVIIFAGVALAVGITRLIMNYVTSLGK